MADSRLSLPAKFREKCLEFGVASVNIANDVERPVFGRLSGPNRPSHNLDVVDVLGSEDVNLVPFLISQLTKTVLHVAVLILDDVGAKLPIRSVGVALVRDCCRHVQDDRHLECMPLVRGGENRTTGLLLNVSRIDDTESPNFEPLVQHVMQRVECL